MRFFRLLFVCLGLLGLGGYARATRINIPDPPGSVSITPISSSPFVVTFSGDCSTLLPGSAYAEMGCFGFLNRSGSDWTGVELTLKTSDPVFSFTCNDQSPATPVFATANCGYNQALGEYELSFSNGVLPNNTNQYFVITEDDLPPADLTFTATYTAATPEPPGMIYMASGAMGLALLGWSRRRDLA